MTHNERKRIPGFRKWPVATSRPLFGKIYRWPKTANERRNGFPTKAELLEMEGWKRPNRRSKGSLEYAWDDLLRYDPGFDSWKIHRLHQWKEKRK
jgi:hypothetical protein